MGGKPPCTDHKSGSWSHAEHTTTRRRGLTWISVLSPHRLSSSGQDPKKFRITFPGPGQAFQLKEMEFMPILDRSGRFVGDGERKAPSMRESRPAVS